MRTIPYVQQADLDRWSKVLLTVSPKVLAAIDSGALQEGRQLALNFRNGLNSAILAYAKGEDAQFSEGIRDAMNKFDLFFAPEFCESVDPKYIRETSEEALCASLLLPDFDSAALAQRVNCYSAGVIDPRAVFVGAVSSLLAAQNAEAEQIARTLLGLSVPSYGNALPLAICAISRGDSSAFLELMDEATAAFDRHVASEAKGTPEAAIFLRGAALVRLFERVTGEALPRAKLDVRLLPALA